MAKATIKENRLVINLQDSRRVLALKSEISVDLSNITKAEVNPAAWEEKPKWWSPRIGTNASCYYGGVFFQEGNKVFYDLNRKEEAVVITLKDEKYCQLVIGVDNPDEVVELIQAALK